MNDPGTRESLTEMVEVLFLTKEQRGMTPHYEDSNTILYQRDNRAVLPCLPENSFDACVCDPPYGISFMSRKWDYSIPSVEQWQAVFRVLKPGAFLLAFGGARTYHRMVCAIEDAGFIIHPFLAWIFGSGFPKATNLSKQIDKRAGIEREVVGLSPYATRASNAGQQYDGWTGTDMRLLTAPATDAAKQWEGYYYGLQALKPGMEPICMAQKPYEGSKAVDSILKWGCGALNIDGCRIAGTDTTTRHNSSSSYMTGGIGQVQPLQEAYVTGSTQGRWPANVLLDDSQEVRELFPESDSKGGGGKSHSGFWVNASGENVSEENVIKRHDSGSASRFFYSAKADSKDRGNRDIPAAPLFGLEEEQIRNTHPTVKPSDLLRYLLTLVTPPGGKVIDPFAGSGSTGVAIKKYRLPYYVTLIEKEQTSCETAVQRLEDA